jgi:peptide/nickel transport system substrate-binding protein
MRRSDGMYTRDESRQIEQWMQQLRMGRMTRRTFVRRLMLLGVSMPTIGWLLAACGVTTPSGSAGAGASAGASGAGGPRRGGTLVINYLDEIPALEPHTSPATASVRFFQLIYTTLLKFDKNLEPVPDLAESWDVSDDALTYTFKLRPGLKFSNGEPLTSDDVKFSFDRILNPKVPAIGQSFYSEVDSVEAPDGTTVVFHMKAPSAAIPVYLAGTESVIISKKVAESGDLTKIESAIGTGPFKVDEWVPDSHMTLSRNPNFYEEGKPYIDGIRVNIVPNEDAVLAAFQSSATDMTVSLDARFGKQAQGVGNLNVLSTEALAYYLFFNQTAVKPLTDPKVRDALNYALDRKGIIDAASLGEGSPSGPIPPANTRWARPTTDWPQYTRDLPKAKQLLADAGLADGFSFTMLTQKSDPVNAPTIAETVQAQWAEIGVNVKIELMEFSAWVQHWLDATFTIIPGNNSGAPDPDFYLYRYFHSTGNLQFVTGKFNTPELDKALDTGRTSTDFDTRKAAYDQAQDILVQGAPFYWLYSGFIYTILSPRVQDYLPRSDESLTNIRDAWLSE